MPSVTTFYRKSSLASDDLPIPALLCAFGHIAAAVLAIVSLHQNAGRIRNGKDDGIVTYMSILLACVLLLIVVELTVCVYGCRGAILEVSKRKIVEPLIHVHAALYVVLIADNLYASCKALHSAYNSAGDLYWPLLHPLIVATWAIIAVVIFILLITTQIFPDQTSLKTWKRRFQCLFLCSYSCRRLSRRQEWQKEDEPPALDQIALVMHRLMRHVDLSYSDVMVSIKLARLRQHIGRWQAVRRLLPPSTTEGLSAMNELHIHMSKRASVGSAADGDAQPRATAPNLNALSEGAAAKHRRSEASQDQSGVWGDSAASHAVAAAPPEPPIASDRATAAGQHDTPEASARDLVARLPSGGAGLPATQSGGWGRTSKAEIQLHPVAARLLTPSHLCTVVRPDLTIKEIVERTCGERERVSLHDMEQAVHYHRMALGAYGTAMYLWEKRFTLGFCTAPCMLCFGSPSSNAFACCCRLDPEAKLELIAAGLRDEDMTHLRPSLLEAPSRNAFGSGRSDEADDAAAELPHRHRHNHFRRHGGGADQPAAAGTPPGRGSADSSRHARGDGGRADHADVALSGAQLSNALDGCGAGPDDGGGASHESAATWNGARERVRRVRASASGAENPTPSRSPPSKAAASDTSVSVPSSSPSHRGSHFDAPSPVADPQGRPPRGGGGPSADVPSPQPTPRGEGSGRPGAASQRPPPPPATSKIRTGSQIRQSLKVASQLYRQALMEMAGIRDEDLIYDSLKSQQCKHAPYYIALDRANKSVVITIRGTLSVEDVITDVMCFPFSMREWLDALPGLANLDPQAPRQQSMPHSQSSSSWPFPSAHDASTASLPQVDDPGACPPAEPTNYASSFATAPQAPLPPGAGGGAPAGGGSPFESANPGGRADADAVAGADKGDLASAGLTAADVQQLRRPDSYGHRGMMTVAGTLVSDLERHNIIPTLLVQAGGPGSEAQTSAIVSGGVDSLHPSAASASVNLASADAAAPRPVAESAGGEGDDARIDVAAADATGVPAFARAVTASSEDGAYVFAVLADDAPALPRLAVDADGLYDPYGALYSPEPAASAPARPSPVPSSDPTGRQEKVDGLTATPPPHVRDSSDGLGGARLAGGGDGWIRADRMAAWSETFVPAHSPQDRASDTSPSAAGAGPPAACVSPPTATDIAQRITGDVVAGAPGPCAVAAARGRSLSSLDDSDAPEAGSPAGGPDVPVDPSGAHFTVRRNPGTDCSPASSPCAQWVSLDAARLAVSAVGRPRVHVGGSEVDDVSPTNAWERTGGGVEDSGNTRNGLGDDTSAVDGSRTAEAPSDEQAVQPEESPAAGKEGAAAGSSSDDRPPNAARDGSDAPAATDPPSPAGGPRAFAPVVQAIQLLRHLLPTARSENGKSGSTFDIDSERGDHSPSASSHLAVADAGKSGSRSQLPGDPGAKPAKGVLPAFLRRGQSGNRRRQKRLLPEKMTGQGWRIVVCGHSMGAGVAAFVGIYLRLRFPHVPLRAYLFSPPASLMSPQIADIADRWTTAVVLGKDVVPRLTLSSLEKLRDQLVFASASCKWNKSHILAQSLWNSLNLCGDRRDMLRRISHASKHKMFADKLADISPEVMGALEAYRLSVEQYDEDEMAILRTFRAPGRCIFLRPIPSAQRQSWANRAHDAIWITLAELVEEGILLSTHMMVDHWPDVSYKTLVRTCERMQLDPQTSRPPRERGGAAGADAS